jgi:hypothetical protein
MRDGNKLSSFSSHEYGTNVLMLIHRQRLDHNGMNCKLQHSAYVLQQCCYTAHLE